MLSAPFFLPFVTTARLRGPSLGLPEGDDPRVLAAAVALIQAGVVSKILVWGAPRAVAVLSKAQQHALVWVEAEQGLQQRFAGELPDWRQMQLRQRGKAPASAEELEIFSQNPLNQAGYLLALNELDAVVAGAATITGKVIRAGLDTVGLAENIRSVSGAFLLHRPAGAWGLAQTLLYGDCAVVIEPTLPQTIDCAAALVATWQGLKIQPAPRLAFLSFSTNGSASHPRQARVSAAAEAFKKEYPQIIADGEMQFDAAFVPAVAARKCPDSSVAGQANCFVFPDLDSANIAYKITQRLGGFAAYGPLLQGLRRPFSDLSRGASAAEIASTALLQLNLGSAQEPGGAG